MHCQPFHYAAVGLSVVLVLSLSGIVLGSSTRPSSEPETAAAPAGKTRAQEYFEEGVRLMDQQKFDQAERRFRSALQYEKNYAEAHSNLGYCLRKQKKYEEAIASYQIAIQIKPDLAQAHEYLGEAYVELSVRYRALAEKELAILRRQDAGEAGKLEQFLGGSPVSTNRYPVTDR